MRGTGNVGGMECIRGDTTGEVRYGVMEDTEVEMGAQNKMWWVMESQLGSLCVCRLAQLWKLINIIITV